MCFCLWTIHTDNEGHKKTGKKSFAIIVLKKSPSRHFCHVVECPFAPNKRVNKFREVWPIKAATQQCDGAAGQLFKPLKHAGSFVLL